MTRYAATAGWCLAFVLVGVLGVALGRLSGEREVRLDFWCAGESAHRVSSEERTAWLTTRFRLNFAPTGLSHMRMVARMIDADSGVEVGTMRRNSAFHVQQQGNRLQVDIVSSAKGEADKTNADLSTSLGMFIFRSDSSLSYWIRPLSEKRYLIDDGNDMFILCSRR